MAPYKGTKIVTYHRSWPNFMERFGLDVMGYVEPKPGIPPSPSHTLELIDEMKRAGREAHRRRAVLRPEDAAVDRQRRWAAQVLRAGAVGRRRRKEATDYIQLFDYDVNALARRRSKQTCTGK